MDVLVVGYGPVGAALAGLLGLYGIWTLAIDKSSEIYLAPRAIALDNEALRILQMVALREDSFAKVAIPFVRMHSPRLGQFGQINTAGSLDLPPQAGHVLPTGARARAAHERHAPPVAHDSTRRRDDPDDLSLYLAARRLSPAGTERARRLVLVRGFRQGARCYDGRLPA